MRTRQEIQEGNALNKCIRRGVTSEHEIREIVKEYKSFKLIVTRDRVANDIYRKMKEMKYL